MKPINRILFDSLHETCGAVNVQDAGVPLRLHYAPDWLYRNGRLKAVIIDYGESYRVNCPFCNDTRKRLYVNHHWALDDEQTGDDMLHLVKCFNEDCLANRDAQKKLHAFVFPGGVYGRQMKVCLSRPPDSVSVPPRRFSLPEGTPLSQLGEGHLAIKYLRQRRFDPVELARLWKVCYCADNREERPRFTKRIVFPVFAPALDLRDGKVVPGLRLAGWQARTLRRMPTKDIPKYLTASGMKKTELLYGLPQAIKSDGLIVVVEGATDVWRLGPGAVALFGKVVSSTQIMLILRYVPRRPVVVLLDADAADNSRRVCQQIRSRRIAAGDETPVTVGCLPAGRKDPGDCTRKEAWDFVSGTVGRRKGHA